MNTIFADLVTAGKVTVYLDDSLIYGTTLQQHQNVTREVLQRLRAHDLYLRPEKCKFDQTKVEEYFGLIIREGEVRMEVKVRAITTNWPAPRNLRELRSFLGSANFYRRFIQNFAKITRPLNDLTKKYTQWNWGTIQQQAFSMLKEVFSHEPILAIWEADRPTRLEVDASGYATLYGEKWAS